MPRDACPRSENPKVETKTPANEQQAECRGRTSARLRGRRLRCDTVDGLYENGGSLIVIVERIVITIVAEYPSRLRPHLNAVLLAAVLTVGESPKKSDFSATIQTSHARI